MSSFQNGRKDVEDDARQVHPTKSKTDANVEINVNLKYKNFKHAKSVSAFFTSFKSAL